MKTKLLPLIMLLTAAILGGCGDGPATEDPNVDPPTPPDPPVQATYTLTSNRDIAQTGQTVYFTVTSSTDEDVTPEWSFSDGTQEFEKNSTSWSRPGKYTVTAHKTEDPSITAENSLTITVTGSTYTISADRETVTAGDEVAFRVTEFKNEVEQEEEPEGFMAGIVGAERFISNRVTFLYPGTYTVNAISYHGSDRRNERARTDNSVTITVKERPVTGHTSEFYHRVFLGECTGSGCQYCPNMKAALEYTEKYLLKDRFLTAAFHGKDSSPQVTWYEAFNEITSDYVIRSMPTYVLNWDKNHMRSGVASYEETPLLIKEDIEKALQSTNGVPGIAIETSLSGRNLSITFKTTPTAAGEYALNLLFIEDNVYAKQSGTEEGMMNHMNLVYDSITDGDGSVWPYKMEGLGVLESDTEYQFKYQYTIPERHNIENCRVIGVINRKDESILPHGLVSVNAASCKAGASVAYEYEPTYE